MNGGYGFDHATRFALAKAAGLYLDDFNTRAPLNSFIMEVQEPYVELLRKKDNELKQLGEKLRHTEASLQRAVESKR